MTVNNNMYTVQNKLTSQHKIINLSKQCFGFWLYLMSDCILFATLFAVYFIMKNNTAYGPSGQDIFQFTTVVFESIALLLSTITYTIAKISIYRKKEIQSILFLLFTLFFGLIFIIFECREFYSLILKGYGPSRSGFLSAFFTIIVTHGFHIFCGIVWILILLLQIIKFGITRIIEIRISCLGLFWHFLDIVWICIFTFVYLIGLYNV
ncbi:cytochrome o ubiquinol oxidase subunit III [Buchnera aphidicola (Formosaphis micheliae)]|uniref:cytochrome o ubiquinol oxidase subunit III n=1 Tax=Buchnera aphidicola TaxID=9 RepID=UPI0031CC7B7F